MNKEQIQKELQFKAVRSSGAGGQHVNKVSSKVELSFDIYQSLGLSDQEKERLLLKLDARLTKEGILKLQSDQARSQHQNKNLVVIRFYDLLQSGLKKTKKRKATRPTKSSVEKRLQSKKIAANKKTNRKPPELD
ncbi:alternative ribosome rescue aminoacyl-tRNA hydrolase ArfB [Flagellimonas sp.]|uniref:alternative ribosome rescue aminoacyl-tRNA hydrolase ArfB n=1 Tax=Flagellimonas sp. TaxID=2058762 RepID=UPI003BAF8A6C